MMTRKSGRPQDLTGREPKEIRCYDFLDSLGITYDRVDHEPAMTMEDCAKIDEVLGAPTAKNLLLANRQLTTFYLLMMPADKPFKTKDLSAALNVSRLSFAPGEYMEELLDITPGSLSFLGLMNDSDRRVQLLIDRDILNDQFLGCHPCLNTTTLRLRIDDVKDKIIPALSHAPVYVTL